MTDLFENPIGLDGFEFVEFSAPEKGQLEPVFERIGVRPNCASPIKGCSALAARWHQSDCQL
jgi:4-hydroxyphenylpyruvate dioxygenase-like putative hemolysin